MPKKLKKKKKTTKKNKKPVDFGLKRKVRLKSLNPANVPRVRQELVDADYLKQLNEAETRWLAQFTDEYVNAAISKNSRGRVKSGHLHNTAALAKECYDANNRRNNDVHGVTKANHLLYNIDQVGGEDEDGWNINNPSLTEDALIARIEEADDTDVLSFDEYQKLKNNLTPEVRAFYEKLYAK